MRFNQKCKTRNMLKENINKNFDIKDPKFLNFDIKDP